MQQMMGHFMSSRAPQFPPPHHQQQQQEFSQQQHYQAHQQHLAQQHQSSQQSQSTQQSQPYQSTQQSQQSSQSSPQRSQQLFTSTPSPQQRQQYIHYSPEHQQQQDRRPFIRPPTSPYQPPPQRPPGLPPNSHWDPYQGRIVPIEGINATYAPPQQPHPPPDHRQEEEQIEFDYRPTGPPQLTQYADHDMPEHQSKSAPGGSGPTDMTPPAKKKSSGKNATAEYYANAPPGTNFENSPSQSTGGVE
jgi:hypothetical protein